MKISTVTVSFNSRATIAGGGASDRHGAAG